MSESRPRSPLRRAALALLLLIPLASLGCVTQHGPIPWEIWRDTYPPDYGMPLEEKEERLLAHLESRHLSPEGMLLYVRPNAS